MPRYVVERVFVGRRGLSSEPSTSADIVDGNTDHGVTWLHSYVTLDGRRSFCVYEAPSPEAIRKAARRNNLPIDRITQVAVLDPWSHQGSPRTGAGAGTALEASNPTR